MKKLLVLTLTVLLTLTVFTACGNKKTVKETTSPTTTNLHEHTTYDDRLPTAENNTEKTVITKEDAKKIVLTHAELNEKEITNYRIEIDKERGKLVYEIEFDSEKHEYDYEINAVTGEILKAEKEIRD